MTISLERMPASRDHATPYPPFGSPCCGRPITDYEPVPPAWALAGLVVTNTTAAHPTLRGLGCCGAKRTAMSGLGNFGFTPSLLGEATALVRTWAAEAGVPVPPMPTDVIDALWQLAKTERELELLRQKLRSMRLAGLTLSAEEVGSYNDAANTYYKAAVGIYNPVVAMIRTANPIAAGLIPPVSRPPSIDAPARAVPWVPSEADISRVRSGDMSGITGRFGEMVGAVSGRLSGGVRGLGIFGVDDLTIGTLILIVIGLVAVAAIAIAIAVPAYALAQAVVAWTVSRAAADVAERRRVVYESCLARGESGTSCASQARELVPEGNYPPAPGLAFGVGGVVLGLAAAGAAYYFLATPSGRARVGLKGLRRRKFRGKKF